MANMVGTNVASAVTTFTDGDKYATAYANQIQGGRHSAATLTDRNAIPAPRRIVGMTCYVTETDLTYKLINNPAGDTTQASDWEKDIPSADDIVLDDGTTLTEKVAEVEAKIAERYVLFCITPVDIGVNDIEQMMQFPSKVVSINAAVPVGTALTSNVVVRLEMHNGTVWSTVDTITVLSADPTKSALKTLTTPKDIAVGNRLRVNVISAQAGIESLVISVGLQLTN